MVSGCATCLTGIKRAKARGSEISLPHTTRKFSELKMVDSIGLSVFLCQSIRGDQNWRRRNARVQTVTVTGTFLGYLVGDAQSLAP